MLSRSWPDWQGEAVAIVGSGPSLKYMDVSRLERRCRVIAIKEAIERAPWADMVYGCDAPWWRHRRGLPWFKGLKVGYEAAACDEFNLLRVVIPNHHSNELLFGETGTIGAGGNSAFQAFNLAVQFGAARVFLFGVDCSTRSGSHWYGRNNWDRANNPEELSAQRWAHAFNSTKAAIEQLSVEVFVAFDDRCDCGITAFKRVPFSKAMDLL